MIELDFKFILSLIALIPAIIAIIKFRQMDNRYYPFAFYMWLSPITEIISYIYSRKFNQPAAVISGIYDVVELFLIVTLFYKWDFFKNYKIIHLLLIAGGTCIWLIENIVLGNVNDFNPYSKIVFSFIFVFLSISIINRLVFMETGNILKNAKFLICTGLLVFFIFYMLVAFFKITRLFNFDDVFFSRIYLIVSYINAFVNILYILAMLCIPKKVNFTTRSLL